MKLFHMLCYKYIFLSIAIFTINFCNAQEGLLFGLRLGPVKTMVQERIINKEYFFKGRISFAQEIYFHGGFNEHIALRSGIEHIALGVKYNSSSGVEYVGVDYFYWNFGVNLRTDLLGNSKIGKRIFLNQSTGISYMNTKEKFSNSDSLITMNQIVNDSSIHNQRNWGLQASLGMEILVFKESFITLDLICNIGLKDIEYYTLQSINNTYVSQGSFISLFLGFKTPIKKFWKKQKYNEI
ncbi:MAG: hypothetical protein K2X86_05260 [Cytophagaceae bacterium]|nr:hypothetical protein [Cytophagaceae bacterium]